MITTDWMICFTNSGSSKRPTPENAIKNFEEFKAGLEQHIVWEEEILFPSFEQKFGLPGGPTEVMRWEHR
jgi:regulator of cell morphogenesis and NO signaling